MSARTFAVKQLERASGEDGLRPGDIVTAEPNLYMSHTASWRCIKTLERLPGWTLRHPERIAMVMDHVSPARTPKAAGFHRLCREFADTNGIETFYDVEAGISHLVLMGNGHIRPGQLIIGTDSHSTIYGALGALGTGVGYSELTAAWVTGTLWMKVPESIRVELGGELPPAVHPMDLMLKLIGDLGADGATYCSVEFHGGHVARMSVSQRMTLCNLAMELGAKCGYVPPDEVTDAYLAEAGVAPGDYEVLLPDEGAEYRQVVDVDCDGLAPHVACPHTVDNVRPIDEVAGTAAYVLEDANPRFAREVDVAAGDVLVAGRHFGQSSGRAIAVKALAATGVGCVVADSFARTFYRNAFEVGLPIVELEGVSAAVCEGDELVVDAEAGTVRDERTGETLQGRPTDPFLLDMLRAGGLIAMRRA